MLLKLLPLVLISYSSLACSNHHQTNYIDKEYHPSLMFYVLHATLRPDPFRGPGCSKCYPPVLKKWEFAQ